MIYKLSTWSHIPIPMLLLSAQVSRKDWISNGLRVQESDRMQENFTELLLKLSRCQEGLASSCRSNRETVFPTWNSEHKQDLHWYGASSILTVAISLLNFLIVLVTFIYASAHGRKNPQCVSFLTVFPANWHSHFRTNEQSKYYRNHLKGELLSPSFLLSLSVTK